MLSNLAKIRLSQNYQRFKNIFTYRLARSIDRRTTVEDIDRFLDKTVPVRGRALIKLSPEAWIAAASDYPNLKFFNVDGLSYELVRALNECGYLVDIADYQDESFNPDRKYDIFIGHGGNCRKILDALDENAVVLQYVSGSFWESFNRESQERYDEFHSRKQLQGCASFTRTLGGAEAGEEYLTQKAKYIFFAQCPRMVESYNKYAEKFYFTGWSSYIQEQMRVEPEEKNYEKGRSNFIYLSGTGGNIQKGADVIIEAFYRCPDLNLFIYSRLEDDIVSHYRTELAAPNIHYIYHYQYKPFHRALKKLMKHVNFTISASINSGISTALIGSFGAGLIPVGYIDMKPPENSAVMSPSWKTEALVAAIREAGAKSAEWCRQASLLTMENYDANWSVMNFRNNIKKLIERSLVERP